MTGQTPHLAAKPSITDRRQATSGKKVLLFAEFRGWFRDIYNAASSFYATIMGEDVEDLDTWLEKYDSSPIQELRSFAYGIRMYLKAVKNAIALDTSNGIVEGFVNKLKAVKRVMYGRRLT